MCLFISLGSWFARLIVSSTLFLFFILHYMYYNLYAFVYWMFLKTVSHAVKRLKKSSLSLSLSLISIVFYVINFSHFTFFIMLDFEFATNNWFDESKLKRVLQFPCYFSQNEMQIKWKISYRIRCIFFLHATLYIKQCRIYLKCLHWLL